MGPADSNPIWHWAGHMDTESRFRKGTPKYESSQDVRDESWWGDLRFEFRRLLGPLDLNFGLIGRWIEQRFTRADADLVRQADTGDF